VPVVPVTVPAIANACVASTAAEATPALGRSGLARERMRGLLRGRPGGNNSDPQSHIGRPRRLDS